MKKTIVVLLSVFLLLPALVLPCLAEPSVADFSLPRVVDDADLLSAEDESLLNAKIVGIGSDYLVDVVIVTTTDLQGKDPMEFADDYYDYHGYGYGEDHDGCLLLIHMDADRGYWLSTTGSAIDALSDDDIDAIGENIVPLFSAGEFFKGCCAFLDDVSAQFDPDSGADIATPPAGIITYGAATGTLDLPRVVDEADLFSVDEELALSEKIAHIGVEYSFDIVLVTVTDLLGKSAMAFADDYYDYTGYGYGENHDGVLLLIHMDADRGYWISTTGLGINALSDSDIDRIGDDIVPSLSAGDYAEACEIFIDDVAEEVNIEINGRGFQPKLLVIGAVIGLVIALIVIAILKGQLKSVKSKPSASDYYIDGSLAVTGAYDVLVGHHVTRTKRESSSSSGGSSTHTGSSGTSHGGGGGRF